MPDEVIDRSTATWLLEEASERIVKPNLRNIGEKQQNVYVDNEFGTILKNKPSINEITDMNGISDIETIKLLDSAADRAAAHCSDDEVLVYLPARYRLLNATIEKESTSRHLSGVLGISKSIYRKQLHTARSLLKDLVKQWLKTTAGNY